MMRSIKFQIPRIWMRASAAASILISASTFGAIPQDLIKAGYKVYTADINRDGCPDYLIKPTIAFIPIAIDDIVIVVPTTPPMSPLLLTSNGTCGNLTLSVPSQTILGDPSWTAANYKVLVGDVAGNGGGSLLLVPTDPYGTVYSISRSADKSSYTYLQSLTLSSLGIPPNATLSFRYVNDDSRTDLVILDGIKVVASFNADSNGLFSTGPSDMISLTTAIWKSFLGALSSSTPSDALQSIAANSQDVFSSAITSPGATPAGFAAIVTSFDVIEVQTEYVRAAVVIQRNGIPMMFFVVFGRDSDGYWKINTM